MRCWGTEHQHWMTGGGNQDTRKCWQKDRQCFARLCYTEATIMEIQRLGSIAPQAVPHRTLADVHVKGYKIPKDTFVFSMLYYIMRDPDYWQNPDIFRPDRFLDSQGKIIKEDRFIPFGVGK